MKFTLVFPDKKRKTIRLGEKQAVTSLLKHLPNGTFITHPRRSTKVRAHKRRLLSKTFSDGDVLKVTYNVHNSVRRLRRGLPATTDKCMITLSTGSKRAKMPCGHAITPQALYDFCWNELKNGKTEIKCPFVYDYKADACGSIWSIAEIKRYANMNKKEKKSVEDKAFANKMKMTNQEIPDINTMVSLLHNSPRTTIYDVSCPLRRACPKCYSIIEYVGGCKTMTCKYPGCGFIFCFRCLTENSSCKYDCTSVPTQFTLL
ncbi:uncharacterized protein LOC117337090 isoform X2 [Pecten maximus]|uniref:uncharacterized protein LOC117337090 isoform X1 n=1 Tax=Pecten maximus TaxID=6579 RepID=UPI001457E9F6|nr:uncharacterized protein LOC117337090 isoform X1 [Pecten maximus]XP_033753768.1 uncharacterized protein LOC117337090 isoform X2 [Pecten maximus]